jgi:hypothetical protein
VNTSATVRSVPMMMMFTCAYWFLLASMTRLLYDIMMSRSTNTPLPRRTSLSHHSERSFREISHPSVAASGDQVDLSHQSQSDVTVKSTLHSPPQSIVLLQLRHCGEKSHKSDVPSTHGLISIGELRFWLLNSCRYWSVHVGPVTHISESKSPEITPTPGRPV